MAINDSTGYSGPYLANGVTVAFPFTFAVMSGDDVSVMLRDADGVETVASEADYSVALTGTAPSAGTVTFDAAPADGLDVFVYLDPTFDQGTTFEDGSAWKAAPVNNVNDRAALRDQALRRDVRGSLRVSMGNSLDPVPSDRANKYLMFDADGQPALDDPDNFASPAQAAAEAAGTARDEAVGAVGAVKQVIDFALQVDAGLSSGAWYAEFFCVVDTTFTVFRSWIFAGSGTADLLINVDDANVYGPHTATTTPDSTVISLTVPAGSRVSIQLTNITGSPNGVAAQLVGLPS